jgi:ComF family protein
MFFTKITALLFDILFPPLCIHCRTYLPDSAHILCAKCHASIALRTSLFCSECMRRLPDATKTCHLDAPYILGAVGSYDDPLFQDLIHALKYRGIRRVADFLGALLVRYAKTLPFRPEEFAVIPAPLSKKRLRERGFNQAELIARVFAESFNIPLLPSALSKTKDTRPQMKLSREERKKNLSGCFEARKDYVEGKHIILIDDVSTSGTTLTELARTLKRAGAKKIIGLVIAKA